MRPRRDARAARCTCGPVHVRPGARAAQTRRNRWHKRGGRRVETAAYCIRSMAAPTTTGQPPRANRPAGPPRASRSTTGQPVHHGPADTNQRPWRGTRGDSTRHEPWHGLGLAWPWGLTSSPGDWMGANEDRIVTLTPLTPLTLVPPVPRRVPGTGWGGLQAGTGQASPLSAAVATMWSCPQQSLPCGPLTPADPW
jgi:hypothetical protein